MNTKKEKVSLMAEKLNEAVKSCPAILAILLLR